MILSFLTEQINFIRICYICYACILLIQHAIEYVSTVFFLKVILSVSTFLKLMLASKINYSMEDALKSLPDKATARYLGRILVISHS